MLVKLGELRDGRTEPVQAEGFCLVGGVRDCVLPLGGARYQVCGRAQLLLEGRFRDGDQERDELRSPSDLRQLLSEEQTVIEVASAQEVVGKPRTTG